PPSVIYTLSLHHALPIFHDSIFVPLAKWPMLITGNYRCIRKGDMISIKDAVLGDVGKSREIYAWVSKLCTGLGADTEDLVPFDKDRKSTRLNSSHLVISY